MVQNVNYFNGYTTTTKVRELKEKIKQLKIDINRLVNISLQYTNIGENKKFPKELIHINDIVFRMFDEIESTGIEIKRLRQKEADNYKILNRNFIAYNNIIMTSFIDTLIKEINVYQKYTNVPCIDHMKVLMGSSILSIYEVDSIWDYDVNSEWAAFSPSAKSITNKFIGLCETFHEVRLAKYIEMNLNDVRVNEEGALYIIYKAVEDNEEKYYKVYFNI